MNGLDNIPLEIDGCKFSTNDESAPMMCILVQLTMGWHVHFDYCHADNEAGHTGNEELLDLTRRIQPDSDQAKDVLTCSLF